MRRWLVRGVLLTLGGCGAPARVPQPPAPAEPPVVPEPPPAEPLSEAPAPAPEAPIAEVPAADPAPQPALAGSGAGATDWTMFHADPARTGRSSAPALRRPRIRWSADVGIMGYLNSPLIKGNVVVVPSSGGTHDAPDDGDGVVALDRASGRVLWRAHTNDDANGAAIAEDRVIVTSDDGTVRGLELGSGRQVWIRKGKGKVYSDPLVLGDLVVVGDAAGVVRAVAARDGDPRWQAQMQGPIRGGIAGDEAGVYVASQGGEVACFGLTGATRWKKAISRPDYDGKNDVPIEGYAAPVVVGELLVVPFARDTYYPTPAFVALDRKTGAVRWRAHAGAHGPTKQDWGNVRSTPALVDGVLVYAEPYSGDVAGIDALTGTVRFRRTVGACYFPQYASPASAGDLVYVPRFDGVLYAVHPSDGSVAWKIYLGDKARAGKTILPGAKRSDECNWDLADGSPLYAPVAVAPDGLVLVGNGAGTLFALEER